MDPLTIAKLDILLRMEFLNTQRESMVAENYDRLNRGLSMAYREENFSMLSAQYAGLLGELRELEEANGK